MKHRVRSSSRWWIAFAATLTVVCAGAGYAATSGLTSQPGQDAEVTCPTTLSHEVNAPGDWTLHCAKPTSLALPARGTFSYPWFPEAWSQNGYDPATHYHPSAGFYSSADVAAQQVQAMVYGGFKFDVSSWWGQNSIEDQRFGPLLTAAHGTDLRIAPYYEAEGNTVSTVPGSPDPAPAQITADLNYLTAHYTSDPSYLWIAGQPAIFVFANAGDDCGMVDRWTQANAAASQHFYLVLKVFPGYATCANQPDNWHQYGPAVAEDQQGSHSFVISPGFFKYNETTPRLIRDPGRWQQDVRDMNCSGSSLQLVTTFNEWGEGTAVESASEWASPSGYGFFLDTLHGDQSCGSVPAVTSSPPSPTPSTPPASPTPTTSSPVPPPTAGHKVLVIAEENHSLNEFMADTEFSSLADTYGQATDYSAIDHPSLPNYYAMWSAETCHDSPTVCGTAMVPSCESFAGTCPSPNTNVWDETIAAGGTARSYAESMPSNCDPNPSGEYVPRHAPWPYYFRTADNTNCARNDVPSGTTTSGALLTDVQNGTLPQTGFLTPNLLDDAHDGTVAQAGAWLAKWMLILQSGPDWKAGRLTIVVTSDEDDGSQNNIVPFIVVDPRLSHVVVTTALNHYALCRWLADNAGVKAPYHAATAPNAGSAFGL